MVKPVLLLQLGKEARLGNGIKGTSAPAQLSTPLEASPAGPTVSLVSVCWQNQAWDLGPPTGQNVAGGGQPEGVQGSLVCRIQLDHCPSGGAQVTVLRARCVAWKQNRLQSPPAPCLLQAVFSSVGDREERRVR